MQKGVAILRAAALTPGGTSVSGLARAAGLPRATALRLIRTLECEGLLVRFPEHDRVVLGIELQRLARAVDVRELLIEASRRPLEALADETRETVTLTVVEPDGSLAVVRQIDPPSPAEDRRLDGSSVSAACQLERQAAPVDPGRRRAGVDAVGAARALDRSGRSPTPRSCAASSTASARTATR